MASLLLIAEGADYGFATSKNCSFVDWYGLYLALAKHSWPEIQANYFKPVAQGPEGLSAKMANQSSAPNPYFELFKANNEK